MNKNQRKQLEEALDILTAIRDEEDEKLSNMIENFSETQKYQEMEEDKDNLDEAISYIENITQK